MKYLTLFDTQTEYETYVNGGGKIYLPNVSLVEENMSVGFKPYHDYSQDYFTMVVTTGGGNITWTGTSSNNKLSYSTNNGTTWSEASSNITQSFNEGDKVLWKGTTTPVIIEDEDYGIGNFSGDDNVRYTVEGNAMSLLFGDDFKEETSLEGKEYAFSVLFSDNKNITSAENLSLPATTLANNCYTSMFQGCTNLTTAPELPATTLAQSCYDTMFQGCTNLTAAPQLPATTLADECYGEMFRGCSSLTTAPELPAIIVADWCYSGMFEGCTSLTTAPELPATTLADECYENMFYGCTSLNSIKCLATDISASNCTTNWVKNVAANGTFIKAANMTSWTTRINGIPSGWTVVDA